MSDVVYILGAGASVDAGAPVMATFLNVAEDLLRLNQAGDDHDHFQRVFQAVAELRLAQARFLVDADNLEAAFSAFEMARVCGGFGGIGADEALQLRDSMIRVITRTIEERFRFPLDGSPVSAYPVPTETYRQFVTTNIKPLRGHDWTATNGAPSIITLNYDIGVDFALTRQGTPFSYDLMGQGQRDAVKLLKLHGSLNWSRCPNEKCRSAHAYEISDFLREFRFQFYADNPQPVSLNISEHHKTKTCAQCGTQLTGGPLLVPPTWNKAEEPSLVSVWRTAAAELRTARYVVFAGYSFPESDSYFKYLLALGLTGSARIRKIIVIDPSEFAGQRLLNMLSPNLQPRVVSMRMTFKAGISQLLSQFDPSQLSGYRP